MPEEHMHQRTHAAIAFLLLSEAPNYTSTGLRLSLSKAAGLSGEAAHIARNVLGRCWNH